ncbi:MAG TPA: hypothetical protein VND93_33300 [Myxococcales bacterium]|nr:hypothetical protein [Myxococcales bacterium]
MHIRSVLVLALLSLPAFAQYTPQAGMSAPAAERSTEEVFDRTTGQKHIEVRERPAPRDNYGNAQGSRYDLAVDGAFDGQTILIIDYYSNAYGQDFSGPKDAVRAKGFSMVRYSKEPSPEELKKLLSKANQFWLIASCDNTVHLTAAHHQAIKEFFDAGHGVYIWGDNDPCNADADRLATLLVDARVQGDLPGDQTVGMSRGPGQPGVVRDHLLSTGVEYVYEGITVATVKPTGAMTPVIYGSAGNLVAAAYEKDGKRLIVDGGFTRLSYKWNTAGTGRYIKNAAAWLANHERFGDQVVADRFKKK